MREKQIASSINKADLTFKTCVDTCPGKIRKKNEDHSLVIKNDNIVFCAVADGMGGENHGEIASHTAIDSLRDDFHLLMKSKQEGLILGEWLSAATQKANINVLEQAEKLGTRGAMGTTLVAAVVVGNKAWVTNVGDSRAYLLRDGLLQRITTDHSLVNIMVEKGLIRPDEVYTHPRRGELLRFLGQDEGLSSDLFELDLAVGDTLLLCSDGLWEMVRDDEIKAILEGSDSSAGACEELISAANRGGVRIT